MIQVKKGTTPIKVLSQYSFEYLIREQRTIDNLH